MKINAIFQIPGRTDVEKVIEGEDNEEIWNSLISEVSTTFPECDKNEITLEKKMPDPIFVARNGEEETLCEVVCEPI